MSWHLTGSKSSYMFQLKIPKPCHADWNEMTPTRQGAFCSSCSKEVVDFTQMKDEEVKNYFLHRHTGSTCGRFRTEQIQRIRISLPDNIFIQKIAGWKKYMAVVLLAFGSMLFGCDVDTNKHTLGVVEVQKPANTKLTGDTVAVDTSEMLGMITMPIDSTVLIQKDKNTCNITTGAIVTTSIMGDISVVQDTFEQPVIDTAVASEKMGEVVMLPVEKKKPVSDTTTCKDPGYY